jgi:hypothetical protein
MPEKLIMFEKVPVVNDLELTCGEIRVKVETCEVSVAMVTREGVFGKLIDRLGDHTPMLQQLLPVVTSMVADLLQKTDGNEGDPVSVEFEYKQEEPEEEPEEGSEEGEAEEEPAEPEEEGQP